MIHTPRVAYLGLSLELYLTACKPNLPIWERAFRNWTGELSRISDVVFSRLCFTDADVEAAGARIAELMPDMVVLSAVSYTPSMLIFPALRKWGLPVVIWNTQDSPIIPDDYVPDDLTNNHTVQGIQDLTNVMFQHEMPFRIVSGHWQDESCLRSLGAEIRAVRAAGAARGMKVLCLGGSFAGMGDFEYDADEVKRLWGPSCVDIGAPEFLEACAAVDDAEAEEGRLRDLDTFEIAPGLLPDVHREAVRRKLALGKLLDCHGATAFTMNFTALMARPDFGQLPFYAVNRLMAEGIGYAGEGDVLRAALMRQLVELCGEANFTEIYTVDFKRSRMFMSHMQECNPGMARKDRKVQLKRMPFWVPGVPDYCGMFFTLEPGEYTLVSMTRTPRGRFRLIAFPGTVPDNVPFFTHYDRAYWLLEPTTNVSELLDRYSLAGGAHHLSAVAGNRMDAVRRLAECLDFDFAAI